MGRKRHTAEQIIGKRRTAEIEQGSRNDIELACYGRHLKLQETSRNVCGICKASIKANVLVPIDFAVGRTEGYGPRVAVVDQDIIDDGKWNAELLLKRIDGFANEIHWAKLWV